MSTTLSERQFPMLEMFQAGDYMSISEAQKFDQRPFRSMLIRKYIVYRPGHGFVVTREGKAAWDTFNKGDILRKAPSRPLTAYFDPTAYGLKDPYGKNKRKVQQLPARGAA